MALGKDIKKRLQNVRDMQAFFRQPIRSGEFDYDKFVAKRREEERLGIVHDDEEEKKEEVSQPTTTAQN